MYVCEHCKDAPQDGRFRRSFKWKTERGFANHSCYRDAKRAAEARRAKAAEKESLWNQWLELGLCGSRRPVDYVREIVARPTHEQRGLRRVRVRYEPALRFEARRGIVEGVQPINGLGALGADKIRNAIAARSMLPVVFIISGNQERRICKDRAEAERMAADLQRGHGEHVRESELNR